MNQSELIKKLRGELTQSEFAEKVGTKQSRISKYESGMHEIPLNIFLEWCEKMGVEFTLLNQ